MERPLGAGILHEAEQVADFLVAEKKLCVPLGSSLGED